MSFRIAGLSRRLAADTKGGVAIIVALSLPVILGFSALAIEYSSALITRTENQRTSDIAAFAAAYAYNRDATASAPEKREAARIAATSIASLNGVSSEAVVVSFDETASPVEIDVTLSEDKPIYLSRLLRPDDSVTINTTAKVSLGQAGGFKACLVALDPDADYGMRVDGSPSGNYNMTNCGVGSNAKIRTNGGPLDISCAAPSFPLPHKPPACREQILQSGFSDPFAGVTSWPETGIDITGLCDDVGTFPDKFLADNNSGGRGKDKEKGNSGGGQAGNTLKPGVLCVTDVANGNFGTVESDPGGIGNALVVRSGVDFVMRGNESLSIRPMATGRLAGVMIYAPGSKMDIGGTPDLTKYGLGCLGLVAGSWRFGGNVTINAECGEDDDNFDAAALANNRPRLIQ